MRNNGMHVKCYTLSYSDCLYSPTIVFLHRSRVDIHLPHWGVFYSSIRDEHFLQSMRWYRRHHFRLVSFHRVVYRALWDRFLAFSFRREDSWGSAAGSAHRGRETLYLRQRSEYPLLLLHVSHFLERIRSSSDHYHSRRVHTFLQILVLWGYCECVHGAREYTLWEVQIESLGKGSGLYYAPWELLLWWVSRFHSMDPRAVHYISSQRVRRVLLREILSRGQSQTQVGIRVYGVVHRWHRAKLERYHRSSGWVHEMLFFTRVSVRYSHGSLLERFSVWSVYSWECYASSLTRLRWMYLTRDVFPRK